MYDEQATLLLCPRSGRDLHVSEVTARASDGEIIDGVLSSGDSVYPVRGGIPRFIDDTSYNPTWDIKWREIDGGRGLNFKIIDKSDPAYSIHDLFDRNGYGG